MPAGLLHPAGGAQLPALEGSQEVDLVLHRGDLHAFSHHGEGRVAAGDIGQCAHGASVEAALLLGHSR